MFPAKISRCEAGYTLLELLVVLGVIALMVAVVPSIYSSLVPSFQFAQFANTVANVSRDTREQARQEGRQLTILIDAEKNQIITPQNSLSPPAAFDVALESASPFSDGELDSITFYPNGMSSGGRLILRHNSLTRTIEYDWISGAVEVVE